MKYKLKFTASKKEKIAKVFLISILFFGCFDNKEQINEWEVYEDGELVEFISESERFCISYFYKNKYYHCIGEYEFLAKDEDDI